MDKFQTLEDIFTNDQFDILNVKPKVSSARNADERLSASFGEVNDFFVKYNKEPQPNPGNISEFQLYSRLKSIRSDIEKMQSLEEQDIHGLLNFEVKQVNSIDDIFNGILLGY